MQLQVKGEFNETTNKHKLQIKTPSRGKMQIIQTMNININIHINARNQVLEQTNQH